MAKGLFSNWPIPERRFHRATPTLDGIVGWVDIPLGGAGAPTFGTGWPHVDVRDCRASVLANLLCAGWTLTAGDLLLRSEQRGVLGGRPNSSPGKPRRSYVRQVPGSVHERPGPIGVG